MKTSIILGPPGTGKTTRLIKIVDQELSSGVRPEEIAYCSFTREGSNQGKRRAIDKFHCKEQSLPYFRTLHSIAFQALRLSRNSVMSSWDYRKFSEKMGMNFLGFYTEDLTNNDDKYLFYNDIIRNNPRTAEQYLDELDADKLKYVMKGYAEYKHLFAKLDFTDMISHFVDKNMEVPVKVAIVDEAQDLTSLQWKMVWIAFRNCERIYIAGDDDQAIYQWSGADVDYFLGIRGSVEVLDKSWRLPDKVLKYAKHISSHISKRATKEFASTGMDGEVNKVLDIDEIEIRSDETYMFLSRNNMFLEDIEQKLMLRKNIYTRKGTASISAWDVRLINLYEEVRRTRIAKYTDSADLKKVLVENYSLSKPWYDSFNWSQTKKDYVRDLVASKVKISQPKINVGTIHSVKGGEADNVVLLMDLTKVVSETLHKNPDSEHRVFYVGATRAKKRLYIVSARSPYAYQGGL